MMQRLTLGGLLFLMTCLFGVTQEHMGTGRISGTVVDENGLPIEGAMILAERLESATKLDGRSDKKGRFAIGGMGSGMWRITASKSGYGNSFVEIKVSQLASNPPISFTLKKMAGAAALPSDKAAMDLFEQGSVLLGQEKYDEALKFFEEFSAKYPDIYQVRLNIGTCYLKKGELERAEAEFKLVLDKALEVQGDLNKDSSAALRASTGLGEVYLAKNDFDSAQKYFSRALEISPQDEGAAYNVGEIFFSHQKIDEAIKYLELATQIKKDWPKPYLKLGYVYLNKGDFGKSLESFNTFLRLDPENPEAPQVKNIIATIEKMKK